MVAVIAKKGSQVDWHDTRRDRGPWVEISVGGGRLGWWWGQPDQLGTCAYWAYLCRSVPTPVYRLGNSLQEEVVACLLGGHGIPATVAIAAFHAVRCAGLINVALPPTADQIELVLNQPLTIANRDFPTRYRFAHQRAVRIAGALTRLASAGHAPEAPEAFRGWLRLLPGVGPKTASWIVRNVTGTPDVAVIDIHVQRAGREAGFFDPGWTTPRDYALFEQAFLAVAERAGVDPIALDCCIWQHLSQLGPRGYEPLLRRELRHRSN
jgi:thermostable 8-oxoguanine DNA glycosylase